MLVQSALCLYFQVPYPYLEDDSAAFCQREVHSRVHFRRPSTSAVALEQCLLGRPLEVYCAVPFHDHSSLSSTLASLKYRTPVVLQLDYSAVYCCSGSRTQDTLILPHLALASSLLLAPPLSAVISFSLSTLRRDACDCRERCPGGRRLAGCAATPTRSSRP